MAHGTLANHHYKRSRTPTKISTFHLTWNRRLNICIGAARRLDYLHIGTDQSFIHRDFKTINILLEENLVAKILDFRLSEGTTSNSTTHVSTRVKADIRAATNDFSDDRLIGEGQLCKVYNGFSDGETDIVAIKRFKKLKSLQHWKEARVEIEETWETRIEVGVELPMTEPSSYNVFSIDGLSHLPLDIDDVLTLNSDVIWRGSIDAIVQCNGSIAVCNFDLEMVMESAVSRRFMETKKYTSPGALKRDQSVCNGGGSGEAYSKTRGCLPPQSNPYDRGCSRYYRCRGDS
ncbi:cold-responsive protein kinase 1-like [Camellia sinensis]|uniref:cold-responsive protein kinase 1-like n=1 Tax=Camellia sinensis TaxID=4442 RepID=UPI001035993C|nr:cold-responsive protein kinase 1-like [Camellia sinensis]